MYNYHFNGDADNTFTFITSVEIVYEIKFKPTFYLFTDEPELSDATYEMTVFPADPHRNRKLTYDPLVFPTIASIFNFFFSRSTKTIVVFICDCSDRKELVRKRKFDGWFDSFNTEKYLKFDVELADSKNNIYYISVITVNQNPYQQIIIQKFESLAHDFRQDK